MSTWNYRTIKQRCKKTGEIYHQIHEVLYNKAGEITAVGRDAVFAQGETEEELQKDLSLMNLALDKPALVLDDIEYADPDWALGYVGLDDFLFSTELRSYNKIDVLPEQCRKAIYDPNLGIGWSKEHHWFVAEVGEKIHAKGGFPVKWSERRFEENDDIMMDMLPYRLRLYVCDEMPTECLKVVRGCIDGDDEVAGRGIGWNEELGWFVTELFDVQPVVIWSEKEKKNG